MTKKAPSARRGTFRARTAQRLEGAGKPKAPAHSDEAFGVTVKKLGQNGVGLRGGIVRIRTGANINTAAVKTGQLLRDDPWQWRQHRRLGINLIVAFHGRGSGQDLKIPYWFFPNRRHKRLQPRDRAQDHVLPARPLDGMTSGR